MILGQISNKILRADGIINDGRENMLFLGIKTREDFPEKEANEKILFYL